MPSHENKRNTKAISLRPLRLDAALRKALSTPPPAEEKRHALRKRPARRGPSKPPK